MSTARLVRWLSVAALAAVCTAAAAQDRRPLHVVVAFAPGGPVDIGARTLAAKMEPRLGQPLIIENRPGGGGAIAAQLVANAAPDGTWLFMQSVSVNTPVFIKDFALDFMRDFDPVASVWTVSYLLFVNNSVPAKNLSEFIAYARANPGKLNYAAATASTMLAMEMLKNKAGIDLVSIPYKGSAPAAAAMLANDVQATFDVAGLHKADVEAGRERALYSTGRKRSAVLPNVPTAAELGLPDLEVSLTGGLWTRAGAPKATLERIAAAAISGVNEPDVEERFTSLGWAAAPGPGAELKARVRTEMDFWLRAAKIANYKPE